MPLNLKSIRRLRVKRGLTVQSLADLAGMNRTFLSAMEHGRNENPKLATIEALAGALGVEVGRILTKGTK